MTDLVQLLIYSSEAGEHDITVILKDDTIWATQNSMASLFGVGRSNISHNISNIYSEGELSRESTCEKISQVQPEGERQIRREMDYYSLDIIISVGYRVNSKKATDFRIWATKVLREYIIKGFAMDDERLKQGGNRYFRELLQRIRDIRSSERNFYQQVTDIYATATDYDPL